MALAMESSHAARRLSFAVSAAMGARAAQILDHYYGNTAAGTVPLDTTITVPTATVTFTEPKERAKAFGVFGALSGGGAAIGLIVGGVLAPIHWKLVFLVSVPFSLIGTVWGYLRLHDLSERRAASLDWWGNITFGVGLVAILVAITYGIQPYGTHAMGWTRPWIVSALIGGTLLLVIFGVVKTKVEHPMFNIGLFRIRAFTSGALSGMLAALGRGGLTVGECRGGGTVDGFEDRGTLGTRMSRHIWAVARVREGLIGAVDEPWRAGLDVLSLLALVALGATVMTLALPAVGHATVHQLTFEGLKSDEQILNFYNTGSAACREGESCRQGPDRRSCPSP